MIDPITRRLSFIPNIPALEGQRIEADIQRVVGKPVSVQNDVNLAAVGEHACFEGGAPSTFVFVSIGTGLGCGIVLDGKVFMGSGGRAGEVGYLPASLIGAGNMEQICPGPALRRRIAALVVSGIRTPLSTRRTSAKDPARRSSTVSSSRWPGC